MRLVCLKCGSVVVEDGDNRWILGAPAGIGGVLEAQGIGQPRFALLTSLRSPGISELKNVATFKEQPLRVDGMVATPISRKHGTDYVIEANDVKILFSQRGDVSVTEIAEDEYDLVIIANKHLAGGYDERVVSWPWPDAEFTFGDGVVLMDGEVLVITKPYSKVSDAPANIRKLDGAPLTLSQVNSISRVADGIPKGSVDNPWAVAISQFKKTHTKVGNSWVKKKKSAEKSLRRVQSAISAEIRAFEDALKDQYPPPSTGEDDYFPVYMEDVDVVRKVAYAEYGSGSYFAIPYDIGDNGDITFADQSDWKKAVREWVALPGPVAVPGKLKEIAAEAGLSVEFPDQIEGSWMTSFKSEDGTDMWVSVSSVAIMDRQGETFSTEAMDWALKFADLTDIRGPLRYRHIPGLDGGDCLSQIRVGEVLLEVGTYRDNEVGQAMKSLVTGDATWMTSLGLMYLSHPTFVADGVYKKAVIFERSMTQDPAVPVTVISATSKGDSIVPKVVTDEELKAAAEELGIDFQIAKTLYAQATAGGTEQSVKEVLKAAGANPGKKGTDEEEDDGEEDMKGTKSLKDVLAGLGTEQVAELRSLMDHMYPVQEKEEPKDELRSLVEANTKALTKLAEALTGQQKKEKAGTLAEALEDVLGGLPREQAAGVMMQPKEGEGTVNDSEVAARLKAIEEMLASQANPLSQIYDAATSVDLNKPRQ